MGKKIEDFKLLLTIVAAIIIILMNQCIAVNSTISYKTDTNVDALNRVKKDTNKIKK